MKRIYRKILIAALAGGLLLWPNLDAGGASPELRSFSEPKRLDDFYRLLESIQAAPPGDQIAAVQSFLNDHPDFEPVYLKLLEFYLFNDKAAEAKAYFQSLAASTPYRQNSSWMLAKLSILDNEPAAAFKAFAEALAADTHSLLLLKDVVEFDRQQGGKFKELDFLHRLALKPETAQAVSAFYSYHNLDFKGAINAFAATAQEPFQHPIVHHLWGECFYRLSRYSAADSLWRMGLAISRRNRDRESEARFLTNLGILAGVANKSADELAYYDSAYAIAGRINDFNRLQLVSGLRAYNYFDRSDYAEAIRQSLEAIASAKRIRAYRYVTSWYLICGDAHYILGEFNEALNAYNQSEHFSRQARDELREIEIKLARGKIYLYLRQYLMAKKILLEAFELARQKNLEKKQTDIKVRLADVMLLEGEYANARDLYREVIKSQKDRIEQSYAISRIARTFMLEGRYPLAQKEYWRAYETAKNVGSEVRQGWALLYLGDIDVVWGNPDEAIAKYRRVREISEKQGNKELLLQAFLGYGQSYQKVNNLNAAIAAYRRAVEIIETSRRDLKADQLRIGYFRERSQVYRNLVLCYFQRYETKNNNADLDSLFYYDEMGRGRALQDLKNFKNTFLNDEEFLQAREKMRRMQRRLRLEAGTQRPAEEWNALLAELEAARYSLLAQQLRAVKRDSIAEPGHPAEIPSLQGVLRKLQQENSGLLFYHISPELSFVLAAGSEHVKVVRLPAKASALRGAIDSLMTPFHKVNEDSIQSTLFKAQLAYQLYEALVKPVEDAIALPERLLIIPDIELSNLAFEMLLSTKPERREYTPLDSPVYANHFLVNRYTFAYSPSTAFFLENMKSTAQISNMLVFANPVNAAPALEDKKATLRSLLGWRFEPLPFAELEARKIQDAAPQTLVRKRGLALKSTYFQEAPQYQILHLATHAFVDTAFDAFSGLALALGPDSTDDGLLMGYEISDLKLNCDLITLSACETGRGEAVAGEGVLGLPRLFLGAGAKSVLMTLWKVDDKFTSELMASFYKHLFRQKLTKAEALSQTKRILLRSRSTDGAAMHYQHPFFWAAFMLFGDANAITQRSSAIINRSGVLLLLIAMSGVFSILLYRSRRRRA